MIDTVDFRQDIYEGMPVFKDLTLVKMCIHNSYEERIGIKNPDKKHQPYIN